MLVSTPFLFPPARSARYKYSRCAATSAAGISGSHRFYTRSRRRRPPWCLQLEVLIPAGDLWRADLNASAVSVNYSRQRNFRILTEHAHVPVVFDEHSRNVRILRMASQSFPIILNRRHEVEYRCGLIVFTVITYTLEWLFTFQPRYDGVGSRARRRTMNFVLSIRNKC